MDEDNNNQTPGVPTPGQSVNPDSGNSATQAPASSPQPNPVSPTPESPQPAPANFNQSQPATAGGEDPGKGLGVAALILAFLVPLVGLILGIIANKKSKEAGHKNGLAKAAIILSIVFMVIALLFVVFGVILGAGAASNIVEQCQNSVSGTYVLDGQTYSCN